MEMDSMHQFSTNVARLILPTGQKSFGDLQDSQGLYPFTLSYGKNVVSQLLVGDAVFGDARFGRNGEEEVTLQIR
jgi:hypothetical protein